MRRPVFDWVCGWLRPLSRCRYLQTYLQPCADAATAAAAKGAFSTSAAEAWPTFEMFISLGGIGELLSFTSGPSSWTTLTSADAAVVVVGIVCSGLLGSFPPSTIEVSLFCGVTSVLLGVFLGRPHFFFLATPTPEVEATADSGVGVGVGFASFRGICGPSNWTPCLRGLISSAAAGADTVTGVVVVVVAGKVFFTGVSPTVARRLDFRDVVRGSDALSPTHCSVGVAVVEIVGAVVVGTVTVSLWTTVGASASSASSLSPLSASALSSSPDEASEADVY